MDTNQNNVSGSSQQTAPQGTSDHRTVMAALAYIGPLVIVPFLVSKQDPFVKFHIRQGLVLLVIEIAVWVITMIMPLLFPVLWLVNLATLILSIVGIVRVTQKKELPLPIVGQYARYFSI